MLPFPDEIRHFSNNYAIADSNNIRGGHHQVSNKAARNSIPYDKRAIRMLVSFNTGTQEAIEEYVGINIENVNWTDDNNWITLFLGIASIETVDSLFDVFFPTFIRNTEIDNTIVGTEFIITDHSVGPKTITVDNEIPYLYGLDNRDTVYDYWGLYNTFATLVKIESVNYETKTITYSSIVGTLSVSDKVTFFNPFRKGRMVDTDPLLEPSDFAWFTQDSQPGGVWKHSDGSYKMLIDGINVDLRVGLATSPDLISWTPEGASPLFISGTAPFNKSWMDTGGMFSTGNPVKIQDSDGLYYYLPLTIINTSGDWEAFICVVDEDMNVIRIADQPIVIPGHPNTDGNTSSNLVYHDGFYKFTVINRAASLQNWTIYELVMGDLMTGEVLETNEIMVADGSAAWYGNHVDGASLMVYKSKLYCFIAGTGTAAASDEVYSGNRTYGIFTKESGSWVGYKGNPIISAPIEGETIWGAELLWATDHIGGYFGSFIEDNELYIFVSMNNGTATYKVAGVKFNLNKF